MLDTLATVFADIVYKAHTASGEPSSLMGTCTSLTDGGSSWYFVQYATVPL